MTLEANKLSYSYPHTEKTVVESFSLNLRPGDFTVLIGPNGCGKTSLLKLLSGRCVPNRGTVLLDGVRVDRISPRVRARSLAFVPQNPPRSSFTVFELLVTARNAHIPRGAFTLSARDRAGIRAALETAGVAALADRSFDALSGGERQRVMVAAALAQEPDYLLLDEPTSAADPGQKIYLMNLLSALPTRPGVLLVTHDLQLAARYARQVILFHEGRILAEGAPREVICPALVSRVFGHNAGDWLSPEHGT